MRMHVKERSVAAALAPLIDDVATHEDVNVEGGNVAAVLEPRQFARGLTMSW